MTATVPVGINPLALTLIAGHNQVASLGEVDNRLVLIDCGTNEVVGEAYVGLAPFHLRWLEAVSRLYCACPQSDVIAAVPDWEPDQTRLIRVGGSPGRLLPVTGHRLYTNLRTAGRIGVIDALGDSLLKTFAVGADPVFLCWLRSRNKVYCANAGEHSVAIIDPECDSVIKTVRVGHNPEPMVALDQSDKVYVVNRGDAPGTVSVLDGNGDSVRAQVTVGLRPRDIVAAPGYDKVYVVNDLSNDVTVIDTRADSVIATVPVGMFPWAICCNEKEGKVYVANLMQATVTVIDCETNQRLRDITVGGGPQVLMWTEYPSSLVFCVNGSVQTISVIDGVTDSVIATLPVGEYPCALEQAGHEVFVANRNSSSITVLDNLPVGAEESVRPSRACLNPRVCRRMPDLTATVFDAQGRKVHPQRVGPGVFFVIKNAKESRPVIKIVIVH
ncbi:MAG: hypothetical protein ABIK44_00630 [candidate division WOR-3 bacterium]